MYWTRLWAVAAAVWLSATIARGEITITVPPDPIAAGEYVFLQVSGLSAEDLPKATVACEPEGPILIPLQDWFGNLMLFFSSRAEGTFTVTVGLNAWSKVVDDAKQIVESASIEERHERLRAAFLASASDLLAAYSPQRGSCMIQVGQAPPPPPPPPPPPAKTLYGYVIEESSRRTPITAQVLASQALRGLFRERNHFGVLDIDVKDSKTGLPPKDFAEYLDDARGKTLPRLYLVNEFGDILWSGPLPGSVEATIELINKYRPTSAARKRTTVTPQVRTFHWRCTPYGCFATP